MKIMYLQTLIFKYLWPPLIFVRSNPCPDPNTLNVVKLPAIENVLIYMVVDPESRDASESLVFRIQGKTRQQYICNLYRQYNESLQDFIKRTVRVANDQKSSQISNRLARYFAEHSFTRCNRNFI